MYPATPSNIVGCTTTSSATGRTVKASTLGLQQTRFGAERVGDGVVRGSLSSMGTIGGTILYLFPTASALVIIHYFALLGYYSYAVFIHLLLFDDTQPWDRL